MTRDYGYIIEYKDLFKSLEGAVHDYTSEAFEGYDKEDVVGLLKNRLGKAKKRLEEAKEAVRALCEPVEPPKDSAAHLRYFCAQESGNADQLNNNEPKRVALYGDLVRAFANIANELQEAGYIAEEIEALKRKLSNSRRFAKRSNWRAVITLT
jgi:type I restriction enzyme, R subunit